jgi:hypothetical protein
MPDPAILSTKQAWVYCGGRPNFDALRKECPDMLRPWRRTAAQGKTYYLREIIDNCLRAAQLSQALVE